MVTDRERGFTILELLLVMLLLALVAAVSYTSLLRGSSSLHLRTSSRDVLNTFRYARERAVSEQTGMIVTVDVDNQALTLSNNLGDDPKTLTLPSDVKINRIALSGEEVTDSSMTVRFLPNGSADEAEVLLQSESGLQLDIITDPLTGGARIETIQRAN